MNKIDQIKFIEDTYPATTNHISTRQIRHTFFDNIETEIQAYLLGFYAADGSIDQKRKTFRIELQKEDIEIIELYKNLISKDARIYRTKEREFIGPRGKIIHAHGNVGIDITSTSICNSLVGLGFGYHKSYEKLHLPNIDKPLIRHFIRGYFDGDGCFTTCITKPENRPNYYLKVRFSIDSKTSSLLLEIQKFLSEIGINVHINYLKRDKMWRLTTGSKKEANKIFHFLYDDSNFYLSRKFNKFNYYVNTEVNQIITDYRKAQEVNVNESNNLPKSVGHPTGMKIYAEPSDDKSEYSKEETPGIQR